MDPDLVEAFLKALREKREGEEFERLMLDDDRPEPEDRLERVRELVAASQKECEELADMRAELGIWRTVLAGQRRRLNALTGETWDEPSALQQLRAQRSLERLQRRHPDVWEQVTRVAVADAGA